MSYREISAALEVMNSLLAHPLADQFQYELREITNRLNSGHYYNFSAWEADMESFFRDKTREGTRAAPMVEHLQKIYNKIHRQKRRLFDAGFWVGELCRLRDKMQRLAYSAPYSAMTGATGIDMSQPLLGQLATEVDLRALQQSVERLGADDQEALVKLIEAEQPELGTNEARVEINMLKMKPETIRKVQEFIKPPGSEVFRG